MKQESELYDYCRWAEEDNVGKFLKQHKDVDMAYCNYLFFTLAISKNCSKMLDYLLQYYFNYTNSLDDILQRQKLQMKLKDILEESVENADDPSDEIRNVIVKYFGDDQDSEQDLGSDCEDDGSTIIMSSSQESESYLTEGNLAKLTEQQVELGGHHVTSFDHIVGS